ncbi:MAG: catecholate siderophore receptor Fiu [Pseudorhodoferax sp.]
MSYIISRKHPRAGSAAAATLVAIAALPVAAQTASGTAGTLREVQVQSTVESEYKADRASSPKLTQPLVDTPQTITVIKKEVLRDQAATTLTDALRNTPGITMQMGENGNTATGDAVYLRGFDAQGSIFVDGIRDVGTITRDMFNIEQVEVVKGPAGTDIGRGSPNGYINLQTKVPFAENDASATVSLGSGSHKRSTLDLNRKLNESGSAAFRLNLMAQDSGVVDRDEVKNKGWGFAPSLALGLGTSTRTYFSYLHMNRRNRPDGGFVTTRLPGWSAAALGGLGAPSVDESNFYGWSSDHDDVDADMFTARIEHDLAPGVTVRNITRWGRTKQDLVLTAPFSNTIIAPNLSDPSTWLVRVLPQGKLQRNEILANQTNITADVKLGGLDHSFSGGLEFAREKQRNDTLAANINASNGILVGTAYQAFANLYTPDMNRPLVTVTPNGASTNGEVTTTAAYLFDTIKLSPAWHINGGVRWEHYRTEYLSLPATGAATAATSLSDSDSLFTGKLGVVYKPAPNGSVYAAYATSARPPGSDFALNSTAGNSNNPNMDPQKARTAELGTKWDVLDKRLALTAALFRTENTNELGAADPVTGTVDQYGKTRVQGIELSAIGQITPAWQLIAGLANTSAKVLEGSRTGTTTGAAVRYSPKLTATLWSTYKLPFGLTVGGGVRYVDTQARSTNTAAVAFVPEIPSYTVLDAMLGYEVNKNFALQLNVFNLTDKFYIARINNAGNRATIGTPRSAVMTATLKF